MLGNLVNRHDVVRLFQKVRRDGGAALLSRFARGRSARVRAAWSDLTPSDSQWWAIWAVQQRWRIKVCGRADLDFPEYVRHRYLNGGDGLVGVVPGCGNGWHVLRWAELGTFRRLDAFDLAPGLVEDLRREASRRGLNEVLHPFVADAAGVCLAPGFYDVVVAEQALHHFSSLDAVLAQFARCLKPGGILYVDEFVGPRRHQWTERQLAAANALLALLPARYRRTEDGRTKRAVIRPSLLRMRLLDPSEAVESDRLLPLLHAHFDVLELRGYGGSLLHILLGGIAHNFRGDDPEAHRWLEVCFAAEDALLASGELADDFIVAVCRPRAA